MIFDIQQPVHAENNRFSSSHPFLDTTFHFPSELLDLGHEGPDTPEGTKPDVPVEEPALFYLGRAFTSS